MRTYKANVAIVNSKSFGKYTKAIDELRKLGCYVKRFEVPKNISGRELAKILAGYQFVIASVTPQYSRDFFENNDDVVMIVRHGIGVDNIDLKAAEEHGVIVARVPGRREREAVAEHTIALLLSALRWIPQAYNAVRHGKWGERAKFVGKEISNLTVGIVGLGNIGSRVAEILSKGFGAKIIVYDPYVPEEKIRKLGYERACSLKELFSKCDVVSLHAVLTDETYHMVNRDVLMNARKSVIIVNTARGELIEQKALIEAIEKGIVASVAMDVVEHEPIDKNHPLLKYENVIITPHIAAYTWEAIRGMDEAMVEAIKSFLENKPIDGVVVMPKNPRKIKE